MSATLDLDGSNPFWPKNMAGNINEAGPTGPTNQVDITSVTFDQTDSAKVTVVVATSPALSAWTFDPGDGSGVVNVPAPGQAVTHTYADKSPGKVYTITVTSGTDTDTRNVQY